MVESRETTETQESSEKQPKRDYKKVKTIGRGAFGTATLVKSESRNKYCVIKSIDLASKSSKDKKSVMQEAKLLEAQDHPNIIQFIEVFKSKKGELCIVMDYANGGDLKSELENRAKGKEDAAGNRDGVKQYLTEDELLTWFTQICLALKYIHDKKILHRDLKSQNIFLTKQGMIKLGDFGIARVLSCTQSRAYTYVGTPYYLSPELIRNKDYSFGADIWALGVLLYEMAALEMPFQGSTLMSLSRRVCQGVYLPLPGYYSNSVSFMIRAMLQVDQKRRPTINEIISWPAIQRRLGVLFQNKAYKQEFARNFTPEGQKPAWEEESAMKDLERKFTEFVIRTVGKDLSHEESKDQGRAMTPVIEEEEYGSELPDDSSQTQSRLSTTESTKADKPISTEMRDEIDRLILLPVEQFREQMIMKFKAEAFDAGFQFVKAATDSNQDLASVEVEDFTEQLKIKLTSLFDDPQQADDFLAFCLDYLIANRP